MRKSISKLIVAGLSLLMTVTATAGVNMTMKDSKTKAGIDGVGVTAVLPARQGKQVKGITRPTRYDAVKGNTIPTIGKVKIKASKGANALQLPAFAPAASSDLYGLSVYSNDWDASPVGLYTISTSETSNEISLIAEDDNFSGASGACVGQGVLYVNVLDEFWGFVFGARHCVYDLETGALIESIEDDLDADDILTRFALEMTYDKTTNLIYGCFYSDGPTQYMFASQDPTTFETTKIADLDDMWFGCAAAADGAIYAVDSYGQLLSVDKNNGALTVIGDTGLEPVYLSSAAIDPKTNVMYFALSPSDDGGYLTTIDLATGEGAILYEFEYDNEFVGLGFSIPSAEPGTPAAPENLLANYEGDLRTGKITFNMPTTTFDGEALTLGSYPYTVLRNGEVIKTGNAFMGSEVEFVDVVPASGKYTYQAYASNEVGDGDKAKTSLWIGPSAPVAPSNVSLSYADGAFTITWDAVESTLHSTEAPEDATYSVALLKNGAMVYFEDEIEGTGITIDYEVTDMLTFYSAAVIARTPRTTSDTGVSKTLALGHAMPPYFEDFVDADSLDAYTIIDANEDGNTWQFYSEGLVRILYNSDLNMDDWMITPPIYIEAGKEYTFSVKVAPASSYFPERLEVMMGAEPTAEGMDISLIDPIDITSEGYQVLTSTFIADETGDFYFGIHGLSDYDMYYILVDYISLSAGVSTMAPDAPQINVVADMTGALNATVSYVAPKCNLLGEETNINKVVITCDGEAVAVNDDVTPSEAYSQVVSVAEDGMHTFSVTAYNNFGAGRVATAAIYVGINQPGTPEDLKIEATANVGEVVATWEAPTTDINGYPLNPDLVTYTVLDQNSEIIAAGLTETSLTFQATTGNQVFAYCVVYAETNAGYSEYPAVSNMLPVGEPYEMPFVESFDDAYYTHILGVVIPDDSSAQWALMSDEELIEDYDGTNGCAVMSGQYVGDSGELYTGRIQLNDTPMLSFAYYAISPSCGNILNVSAIDFSTNETKLLKSIELNGGEDEWVPVLIDLKEFAGKQVSFIFEGIVMTNVYIIFDQLKVFTPADYDLAVLSASAPAMVAPDEEFEVTASVINTGLKTIDAYKVVLERNGEVVAAANCEAIASGDVATHTFSQCLNVANDPSNVYVVKIECAADEALDNNASDECPVYMTVPNYPTASDLKATVANGITLTWTAPNLDPENLPTLAVTDDFESYESFIYEDLGAWTLNDVDSTPIGGVSGINFPNIIVGETTCAYYVMNTEQAGLADNESFLAHSGVQYLVSTFIYDSSCANNDWLISPELSGNAQTISFYAKSYSSNYPETFSVYYSTTDSDVESFEKVGTAANVPADWTLYNVQIPEGSKYFAIVCESFDKFMFFVDDVTYIPANGEPMELSLVGYNIYRNGVKINAEPVAETSYVDAEGSANDVYVVSVVYAEGESGASNSASAAASADPEVSGIDSALAANALIKVVGRSIVITGAQGEVNVFTADGKMLYKAAAQSRNSVSVLPGVYVVKAGKLTEKVVVK